MTETPHTAESDWTCEHGVVRAKGCREFACGGDGYMQRESARDVLANLLWMEAGVHSWDPVECVCSCGAVPPVVNGFHAVDRHVAEAQAGALLSRSAT